MGIISVEQADRLYWLGRYTERVYTTLRMFSKSFDTLIDGIADGYVDFCKNIDIPNIYGGKEDFVKRYPFDPEIPDSIISNLKRAYDNAIVLREEIGSESLAYIQLAIYDMQKAAKSNSPMIEFQRVLDNLMAFWGIVDDQIASENVRNILKVGKRVERIDLYGRLHSDYESLSREIYRLAGRVKRCNLKYSQDVLDQLVDLLSEDTLDHHKVVEEIERFLEV